VPCFEIVRVVDERTLENAMSRRCAFESANHAVTDAGFYIVIWPESVRVHEYDARAKYFGPFASRRDATDAVKDAIFNHYELDTDEGRTGFDTTTTTRKGSRQA
jgi:hypothetical protein